MITAWGEAIKRSKEMKTTEATIFIKGVGLKTVTRKEWDNLFDEISENTEIEIVKVNWS